ncbi:MAG: adenosylcobinamide-GDP ribazoletransferase [Chloroflexota bacterium]
MTRRGWLSGPLAFLAALSFLTVWRLSGRGNLQPRDRGRALFFFAPVGLLLGGLAAAINAIAALWWPSAVGTVLVIAALLLGTGGLHFDGLLDTCDGALNGQAPERRLEIMRDSRSGAFAVAGGVVDLLLLWACIVDLTGPHQGAALLVMATTSRAAMALAVCLFPYGRPAGLGRDFKDHASALAVPLNVVLAVGLGWGLLGWQGVCGALGGLVVGLLASLYLLTRLPGLTGDSYGAINELAQIGTLLVLMPLLS